MTRLWLAGLLRRRGGRILATASGVALAVALVASLGAFLTSSQATMTTRAVSSVAVDWQVQLQPGADVAAVGHDLTAAPGVHAIEPVLFAPTTGYQSAAGGTSLHTGPGVLVGITGTYQSAFPGSIRSLVGSHAGVLVAQQTASNLHIHPGSTVTIGIAGRPAATLTVSGVVDLPQADSFFQRVGAAPSAQPVAPPDNVLVVPSDVFARLTAGSSATVVTQLHVARSLPAAHDPATAYTEVRAAARNLEATAAGTAVVGDNVGAALDAARADSAYATLLFGFLGLPGALLAALLTSVLVSAGAARRREEQALLRTRGLTNKQVGWLAAVEALIVAGLGATIGLVLATVTDRVVLSSNAAFSAGAGPDVWYLVAPVLGLVIALLTVLVPALRDLRAKTIHDAHTIGRAQRSPWWARYGLDLIIIGGAITVFWATSQGGYALVLAPEGVPQISVSSWALLGPALLWVGGALLLWRAALLTLRWGRRPLALAIRPLAGRLSRHGSSTLSRRRPDLAKSMVLLSLSLAFAASTSIFNSTYAQQAEAAAQLANGADVTVTEPPSASVSPSAASTLSQVAGVQAVEPVQHRFAYVGSDLQDLYGVRPSSIAGVSALQDAYFIGGTARQLMATLAADPHAILVSRETAKDYQLTVGDTLRLRLQNAATSSSVTVPFRFVGIVTKFPTAPKDSFFVANASYIAQVTGSDAVGTFLVNTGGTNQPAVAAAIRRRAGSATVTDLTESRAQVGSSLTSVNLHGLTSLELGYAVLIAVASGALVLGLGLTERRRSQAIMAVLGATLRQLRGLVVAEAAVVLLGGAVGGALLGWTLSQMLVKVLTGVFDPPPDAMAVPLPYLSATGTAVVASLALASVLGARAMTRPAVQLLREL